MWWGEAARPAPPDSVRTTGVRRRHARIHRAPETGKAGPPPASCRRGARRLEVLPWDSHDHPASDSADEQTGWYGDEPGELSGFVGARPQIQPTEECAGPNNPNARSRPAPTRKLTIMQNHRQMPKANRHARSRPASGNGSGPRTAVSNGDAGTTPGAARTLPTVAHLRSVVGKREAGSRKQEAGSTPIRRVETPRPCNARKAKKTCSLSPRRPRNR
jgi:hypothetical protein